MTLENIEQLINPKLFQDQIKIEKEDGSFFYEKLKMMMLIRFTEEKLAYERENGNIGGPVHLGAGQEAIAVGISNCLNSDDRIFGAHRSHSHLLSLNPDTHSLFAEVLGKETGFSRGMGGSMHLIDEKSGFYGSVPIVSGTVPIAVGAAYQLKRQGTRNISVVYLGDGAMEEGVVHESLNLSSILPAPVLFVVENNLFSSHMHISLRQPNISVSRFAYANNIPYKLVDGNNISQLIDSSKELIEMSRENGTPSFIEAVTFRHYGHVDWRKDIDVGVNRSVEDLENWIKRDPISRLINGLISIDFISKKEINDLEKSIKTKINSDWKKAENDPFPNEKELLDRVYFENQD